MATSVKLHTFLISCCKMEFMIGGGATSLLIGWIAVSCSISVRAIEIPRPPRSDQG